MLLLFLHGSQFTFYHWLNQKSVQRLRFVPSPAAEIETRSGILLLITWLHSESKFSCQSWNPKYFIATLAVWLFGLQCGSVQNGWSRVDCHDTLWFRMDKATNFTAFYSIRLHVLVHSTSSCLGKKYLSKKRTKASSWMTNINQMCLCCLHADT